MSMSPNHFEIKWEISRKTQSHQTVGNNSVLLKDSLVIKEIKGYFKMFWNKLKCTH